MVIYTGEGGRDPTTGRQVADQTLSSGNAALVRNCVDGSVIRVTRGHALDSRYAPATGYRYDGLYQVTSHWQAKGRDGFSVFRFRLERCPGQPPIGQLELAAGEPDALREAVGNPSPERVQVISSRVVRTTAVGARVKSLYDYRCQLCDTRLETPAGFYAECCHIRPLGRPHNGPDTLENVLCLCPNCHVLFDSHALILTEDLLALPSGRPIHFKKGHAISKEHVLYHRNLLGHS